MRAFEPPSAICEATSSLRRKLRLLRSGSGGRIGFGVAGSVDSSEAMPKSNCVALASPSSISCRPTPAVGRPVRRSTPGPGPPAGPTSGLP